MRLYKTKIIVVETKYDGLGMEDVPESARQVVLDLDDVSYYWENKNEGSQFKKYTQVTLKSGETIQVVDSFDDFDKAMNNIDGLDYTPKK